MPISRHDLHSISDISNKCSCCEWMVGIYLFNILSSVGASISVTTKPSPLDETLTILIAPIKALGITSNIGANSQPSNFSTSATIRQWHFENNIVWKY